LEGGGGGAPEKGAFPTQKQKYCNKRDIHCIIKSSPDMLMGLVLLVYWQMLKKDVQICKTLHIITGLFVTLKRTKKKRSG